MRLLLVNPTVAGEPEAVHLGLVTVGTYLQERSGHEARVLDFAFHHGKDWRRRLAREVSDWEPDVVGMYISTPFFPNAKAVADELKRIRPEVPLVAGGHHATLSPRDVLAHPSFDMLVVGEGEKVIVTLMDALAEGAPLDGIAGLWLRDGDGKPVDGGRGPLVRPDDIPPLDWGLYDDETLRKTFDYFGTLPVMGSRGCPSRCSFCAITNVQRLYHGEKFLRFRDPIAVVDEIEASWRRYAPMGLRIVYFYDLNFLVNPRWLETFTAEYRRRGLHRVLPWSAYTRADHVSPRVLRTLEGSGCVNLRVGIEAANEHARNVYYNKELPQAQLRWALRAIKDHGITITGYFLVGGPGERPEWLMESMELAYDEGIEYPAFFLYKPLAGTDVLQDAAAMGSFIDGPSMDEPADFMRGVNMVHRHVTRRQLVTFHFLTQAMFGSRILSYQLRRERLGYLVRLARYVRRATGDGFSAYEGLIYFAFYGEHHLSRPHRFPTVRKRPAHWRAALALLQRYMRSTAGEGAELEARGLAPTPPTGAEPEPAPPAELLVPLGRAPRLVPSKGTLTGAGARGEAASR